ncbi:MAG: drug/metabolite transporter (DMT)-like permease [Candidatus Promineifilaceae bacterium]|jgi:drug/metabolite transporter (DMT)-like permease
MWAHIGLVYAAIVWGATFVTVKDALVGVDPVTMVAYRFLIAGVVLLVWLLVKRRPLFRDFGKGAILSVCLAGLYIAQTVGLQYTTATNSGFITGLFVLFVPVLMIAAFKTRPNIIEWIACVVSLAGLWVLTGGMRDVNIGDVMTILSAAAYALHLLFGDRYMKAGADPIRISCQQFMLVGIMCVLISAATGRSFAVTGTSTWVAIIFLGLFPTLSAFVIMLLAQRTLSALRVSLIVALEPVFAAAFAWTIGGEMYSAQSIVGGFLIVTALAVTGLNPPKRRP